LNFILSSFLGGFLGGSSLPALFFQHVTLDPTFFQLTAYGFIACVFLFRNFLGFFSFSSSSLISLISSLGYVETFYDYSTS
jgi:hypothetical protein